MQKRENVLVYSTKRLLHVYGQRQSISFDDPFNLAISRKSPGNAVQRLVELLEERYEVARELVKVSILLVC